MDNNLKIFQYKLLEQMQRLPDFFWPPIQRDPDFFHPQ